MTNQYYTPSQTAEPGTTVRSAQFNGNNDEIEQGFDLLPSPSDLSTARQNFAVATTVLPNIYAVSINPSAVTQFVDGQEIKFRISDPNTGPAQLNFNNLGLKQIRTQQGESLASGDMPDEAIITVRFNLTEDFWQLDSSVAAVANLAAQAAQSATNAATSETNAAASATTATQQATRAENEANRAQGIADNLVSVGDAQVTRVTNEGNTQVSRVTSEGDAQVSRVQTEGGTQVQLATTQANNAANSATAAAGSETAAAGSATAAANSATAAANSATEAEAQADRAQIGADANTSIVISEAQSQVIRRRNREEFAASGSVHFGLGAVETSTRNNINEGLYTNEATQNVLNWGREGSSTFGTSKTSAPKQNIAGSVFDLSRVAIATGDILNQIEFPESPNGRTTFDSSTGAIVVHVDAATAFAAETTTNKVITERKDLAIIEYFLEEVTDPNLEIFPVTIQNQSTTFGDTNVPTIPSIRPDSYFAQYDGQAGITKGRCVRWGDLTTAQKRDVATYLGENLFVNAAGNLVNGRVRMRTFAGAGNGDWGNISTISGRLEFDSNTPARVQGNSNTVSSSAAFNSDANNRGLSISSDSSLAYNGECYALPICEVTRLNQGAFHPSLNPLGSGAWGNVNFGTAGNNAWWEGSNGGSLGLTASTQLEAFTEKTTGATNNGSIAGGATSNRIRPDNRFFDAIYESGQGGVIDRRLSAHEGLDWWQDSDRKMKRTKFRGLEGLPFTRVFNAVGDVPSGWIIVDQSDSSAVVATTTLNNSISGTFSLTEVLGVPADVRDVSQLSLGWIGYWNPTNAVGGYTATLTRDRIGSGNIVCQFTTNDGSSWTARTLSFNEVPNTLVVDSTAGASGSVVVCDYQAYAYQTEQSSNMVPVDDLGKVWFSANHDVALGSPLVESFIDKVPASDAARPKWYATQSYVIGSDDELDVADDVGHATLDTTAPTNSSRAVAALVYPVEINGQIFLQYQVNEKQHNATNWGGSVIELTETGVGTYTDDNGNAGLRRGVFISALPIGWVKQRAEAGSENSPA